MNDRNVPRRVENIFTGEKAMSKLQYRQAEEFSRSLRNEIGANTRAVIGSAELISGAVDRMTESSQRTNELIADQTSRLESKLDVINDSLSEITDALYWGFGLVSEKLEILDASIKELIRVAKTPSQIWALEQFETARDEYRRQLFPESLASINRAIEGFGSQPGYRSDFRFHALLGILRLGSFENDDASVVDLNEAERAFLDAARYARSDAPEASGESLLSAGRAALLRNDFPACCEHTRRSLLIGPAHHRKYYQLALGLAGQRDSGGVATALTAAFVQYPPLAVEAAHEALFRSVPGALDQAIATARDQLAKVAENGLGKLQAACRELQTISAPPFPDVAEKGIEVAAREREVKLIAEFVQQNTLLSVYQAMNRIEFERSALKRSLKEILAAFNNLFSGRAEELRRGISSAEALAYSHSREASKTREKKAPYGFMYFLLFGVILLGWDVVKLFGEMGHNGMADGGENLLAIWHAILRAFLYVVIAPIAGWLAGAIHNGVIEAGAGSSDASAESSRREKSKTEATINNLYKFQAEFNEKPHAPLILAL